MYYICVASSMNMPPSKGKCLLFAGVAIVVLLCIAARHRDDTRKIKEIWHGRVIWQNTTTLVRNESVKSGLRSKHSEKSHTSQSSSKYETAPTDTESVLRSTVFTIKAHDRPGCLLDLVKSFKAVEKKMKVIIGDDSSHTPMPEKEVSDILGEQLLSYIHLPKDSGTGYGRNRLVESAQEHGFKYFVMSDDDYSLENNLFKDMASALVKVQADVVAAQRCEPEKCNRGNPLFMLRSIGTASDGGDEMFLMEIAEPSDDLIRNDIVQQFFIAKTSIGPVWDDKLKNNDHYDAMLTMKRKGYKLYTHYGINIKHNNKICGVGSQYKTVRGNRWNELMPYFLQKWKISSFFDEVGREWSVDARTGKIQTRCGIECAKLPKHKQRIINGKMQTFIFGKCQNIIIQNEIRTREVNSKDCPVHVQEAFKKVVHPEKSVPDKELVLVQRQIVIVIPYRDRAVHYKKIMEHLPAVARENWNIHTILVEQNDRSPFRRAWLLNIGIAEAKKRFGDDDTCVVTHDVDMLADSKVDYGWCDRPTQICSELSCFGGGVPYAASGGGVVQATLKDWYAINGYTNTAIGWGGEDDDLHHRFQTNGLVSGGHLRRPAKGFGKCHCLNDGDHTKRVRDSSGYKDIVSKINRMKKGSDEWKTDGLNSLKYVISEELVDDYGTIKLKVNPSERLKVNPPERQKRDFLLFTSAGDKSNVKQWIGKSRNYDIVVVYYGKKKFDYNVDELYVRKNTKFPNLQWYMKYYGIGQYKAVAVWDDDIVASPKTISALFTQMVGTGTDIFSPCHTRGSFASMFKYNKGGTREVEFLEMNAPIFTPSRLKVFMSVFDPVIKGWGADVWYGHQCNRDKECSMSVSDSFCVTNPETRQDGTREINVAQSQKIRQKTWEKYAKNILKQPLGVPPSCRMKGYDLSPPLYVVTLDGVANSHPSNDGRLDAFIKSWEKTCGKSPNIQLCPGELDNRRGYGLTKAYVKCLQMAIDQGRNYPIILEDDARLTDKKYCKEREWTKLPPDAFVVMLGGHHWKYANKQRYPGYKESIFSYGSYGFMVPRHNLGILRDKWNNELKTDSNMISPDVLWYSHAANVSSRIYATSPLRIWHESGFSNTWNRERESIDNPYIQK